jgi:hypothetical protein
MDAGSKVPINCNQLGSVFLATATPSQLKSMPLGSWLLDTYRA